MFKRNESHTQGELFSIEEELHPRLKKKLEGHWSGIFYEKVFMHIDETIFQPLYDENIGRGNFPVNILIGLEILKEMHSVSDEQILERYHFDYLIRHALGLKDINDHILSPRTLYYFRSSLAEYEMVTGEDLMMHVFKDGRDKIIEELGLKTGLQRTDSTLIGANIKKMSRLMLFHKVLSNLVADYRKHNIPVSAEIMGNTRNDEDNFNYYTKKEEVLSKTKELGGYIYQLKTSQEMNPEVNGLKSYKDAERLLKEQCDLKNNKLQLKVSKDIESSSMQNPGDGDATYRSKNNKEYRGYSAHGTETCDKENKMQVITDVDVVKNNVDDAEVLSSKIEELKDETGLDTIITDATFANDEVRGKCKENEVKIVTSGIRGRPAKNESDERLKSRDFNIDEDSGKILSCPAGQKPRSQKATDNSVTANFNPNICFKCKKKDICPAFISEKLSRIVIDDKRKWLDERCELIKTEAYRALCNLRPPVEGLMEKLRPKYLAGRILFRGLKKVKTRIVLRAIGINFRRYARYIGDMPSNIFIYIIKYIENIIFMCFLRFKNNL